MNAVEGFNHCIFRGGSIMKKFTLLLVGVATLAGVVVFEATASRHLSASVRITIASFAPRRDGGLSLDVGSSCSREATS